MEKHIDREVDRVAERCINAIDGRKSRIKTHDAGDLEKPIETDHRRNGEGDMPERLPEFLGIQDARGGNEIGKKVRECYPSVHPLVIAPKTLGGIDAEHIGERNDEYKKREGAQKPGARYDLDNDAKGEILPRDEGEEKRLRDDENDEGKSKNTSEHDPPKRLFDNHIARQSHAISFRRVFL